MDDLLPVTAHQNFKERFDDAARLFVIDEDLSGKRKYVVERIERAAFTQLKSAKRKRIQEIEPLDPSLVVALAEKEAQLKDLVQRITELRDSSSELFATAAKRAKTVESVSSTPAKSKPVRSKSHSAKTDLYLEKLQKGSEKLKQIGEMFQADQDALENIHSKQSKTRVAAEAQPPRQSVIPRLGSVPTPKPKGSASRSRIASLFK